MIIAAHYCVYKELLSQQPLNKVEAQSYIKSQLKAHFLNLDSNAVKALSIMGLESYAYAIQIQLLSLQYKVVLHPVGSYEFIGILKDLVTQTFPELTV
ncbi:hypothetical protein [Bdellovibrio reynosensis]|uniref:Uncharacterized protein n=1 Tax=Bdellovibrio reynosensis TaxID=2835041 RepID=A0ABY4C8Q8_9BACT|nr:hypothetical protein [Bdellovibrio reynosensis]UOF01320.1 hypothetical protein MNR06_16620 [Bdellovibrio reynosensis]